MYFYLSKFRRIMKNEFLAFLEGIRDSTKFLCSYIIKGQTFFKKLTEEYRIEELTEEYRIKNFLKNS